jgi:hypothetical protein
MSHFEVVGNALVANFLGPESKLDIAKAKVLLLRSEGLAKTLF